MKDSPHSSVSAGIAASFSLLHPFPSAFPARPFRLLSHLFTLCVTCDFITLSRLKRDETWNQPLDSIFFHSSNKKKRERERERDLVS
jgi:hypothetical protein